MSRSKRKFEGAVRLAREASRDSWQHARDRKEAKAFRRVSREAIGDARYWLSQMQGGEV